MALRKSPEEKAADKAAYEFRLTEDARNQARIKGLPDATAPEDPEPWVVAADAFARGDTFLQLELPHSSVTGQAKISSPEAVGAIHRTKTPQDTLGKVEAAGWRLEHASWVFIQTGQTSRDKMLTTGQRTVTNGEVVGIYLFRRDDALG